MNFCEHNLDLIGHFKKKQYTYGEKYLFSPH